MRSPKPAGGKLLIISGEAGSVDATTSQRIKHSFADYECVPFDSSETMADQLRTASTIVVAGGDGSVGYVARALVGTGIPLGIIPAGTFNNFAQSLSLPSELDAAIEAARDGVARPITLGMVESHAFLETASIGLFGEAIRMGETLKERMFREFPARLGRVIRARPFQFSLQGDIDGQGSGRSLVFSNTKTSGTNMPVGDSTPEEPSLDLSIRVGESRRDLVSRVLGSLLLRRRADPQGMNFSFKRLTVTTSPQMTVWADDMQIAQTPVTITSRPDALRVIFPP